MMIIIQCNHCTLRKQVINNNNVVGNNKVSFFLSFSFFQKLKGNEESEIRTGCPGQTIRCG